MNRLFALAFLVLLLSGCAHFVTDKNLVKAQDGSSAVVTATKYLDLTVTFAKTMATDATYYIVVSTTENMTMIDKSKTPTAYFVSPIDLITDWAPVHATYEILNPLEDDITPLYDTYFKTWDQIYTYSAGANQLLLFNGPFITSANQGKATGGDRRSYLLSPGANQLHVRLPIPADNFWFQVLAVNQSRILIDHLPTKVQVQYINNNYPASMPLSPGGSTGLDITSYQIGTYEN